MSKRYDVEQVRAFIDLLSEEILSLSDEEVLARAKGQGVDVSGNLRGFQRLVNEQAMTVRRRQLQEARKAVEAHEPAASGSRFAGMTFDELKTQFAELLAKGALARDSRLSMAFRNGKEIDEEDLRSALEDYEELLRSKDGREPDIR